MDAGVERRANRDLITFSNEEHVQVHQEFSSAALLKCVCTTCVLQCYPAGVPGGAVEELSGHAGADAGRERLSGDWLPA